ncbi:MAG: methyl-accepting chemotaxis protein [Halanaerobiales bacterium]|nr:methyl-accepting chemotaxis protein [Halanaerobiales bacterium]
MRSIKNELIVILVVLVLVPFIVSSIRSDYLMKREYKEQIKTQNKVLAIALANNIGEFISKAYTCTEDLAYDANMISFDPAKQRSTLMSAIERNQYFDLLYVQKMDGMQTARSSGQLGNRYNRWWFQKALSERKPYVSKSYYSLSGNAPCTSIIIPMFDHQKMIGVVASDFTLDIVQEIVDKLTNENGIYAIILDGEGVVVAAPEEYQQKVKEIYNYKTLRKKSLIYDKDGNPIFDEKGNHMTEEVPFETSETFLKIVGLALDGKSGVTEDFYIDVNDNILISAYSPILLSGNSANWAVFTFQDRKIAMKMIYDVRKGNLIFGAFLFCLVLIVTICISNWIANPIRKIEQTMNRFAQGNLRERIEIRGNKEIISLTNNFNKMAESFEKIIIQLKNSSNITKESSYSLSEITGKMNFATQSIAHSIEEVATVNNDQAKHLEDGVREIEKLAEQIDTVDEATQRIGDIFAEKVTQTQNGKEIMTLLIKASGDTAESDAKVNDIVTRMNQMSDEIGSITNTIGHISTQTNLLALNASIEAARAGENGRGFAVVAEEIRKLAEQSGTAADHINRLIEKIQNQSRMAVEAIQKSIKVRENQTKAINETELIFNDMIKSFTLLLDEAKGIQEYNREMTNRKDGFVELIRTVSAAAQQSSANAESVSASTEEQLIMAEKITTYTQNLHQLALEIEKEINQFKN